VGVRVGPGVRVGVGLREGEGTGVGDLVGDGDDVGDGVDVGVGVSDGVGVGGSPLAIVPITLHVRSWLWQGPALRSAGETITVPDEACPYTTE